MANVVNAERVTVQYGTRLVLDEISLGVSAGDVVGVVGRNGSGKTTLLRILTGADEPDSGRVVRTATASIGYLHQADDFSADATVRDVIVGGEADHVWAADSWTRALVEHLLGAVDLDTAVEKLSGGERRRTALVALMLGGHDLLVLDEPTNHLDVEAVDWLARHLRALQDRGTAMLVVSHDRWFLDAVCSRVWEVHDGVVDAYDGGYAAYVLARAERGRQAAQVAARRKNLLRKELAWLRRGPPARTSKPKFRIEAANTLIADEPPPRDRLELEQFSLTRLGKDVFDLTAVSVRLGGRTLIEDLSWSIGPGDRIGLIGVNGTGKTTLLRLLTGDQEPDSGRIKRGRTLAIGHLSQTVVEQPTAERVLDLITRERRVTQVASGREVTATSLLEDFGFTGERLTARVGDLSGGERRRLQLLRLLVGEPNVLLLDEPTNDLDIDTLTVVEDYLDSWPGTLIVVSHDRYFLERVCDVTYALLGDGQCVLLPGGVDQYLALRHAAEQAADRNQPSFEPTSPASAADGLTAGEARQARKDLARIEGQIAKVERRIAQLHQQMAENASDYGRLADLQHQLTAATDEQAELEESWLTTAESLG
ncbi:MAG: ABC-F family ATP-binding cassette domain-containing protein [Microlunatus sp.]|nr:ABC-F family ATP-binding cassette domain-containing protein [Microlunatus sp.]MDN5803810.1 ABC-F family ATP-binding cassette domain-containing protein [Microlunatus sp.]